MSASELPPHLAALQNPSAEPNLNPPLSSLLGTSPIQVSAQVVLTPSIMSLLPSDPLEALIALRRQRIPCALCTVISTAGSSPRKPGARMLVLSQNQLVGTIGGGAIEQRVVDVSLEVLQAGSPPQIIEHHLSHDLGMCCGGKMKVFIEPQLYPPQVILFGAGHISIALCAAATLAGFEVTVIDERPELCNAERFPAALKILCAPPLNTISELHFEDSFTLIVTHDHALDQEILAKILPEPIAYLGLIGSIRKREKFKQRLGAQGFDEATLAKFRTPMGLNIGAITPAEIAISVVAEMILSRRRKDALEEPVASMNTLGKGYKARRHETPNQ